MKIRIQNDVTFSHHKRKSIELSFNIRWKCSFLSSMKWFPKENSNKNWCLSIQRPHCWHSGSKFVKLTNWNVFSIQSKISPNGLRPESHNLIASKNLNLLISSLSEYFQALLTLFMSRLKWTSFAHKSRIIFPLPDIVGSSAYDLILMFDELFTQEVYTAELKISDGLLLEPETNPSTTFDIQHLADLIWIEEWHLWVFNRRLCDCQWLCWSMIDDHFSCQPLSSHHQLLL